MSFLTSVFKAQDALEDQEQGALESEKHVLKGMLFWGKKSPYAGNEFALGRERMPSCLQGLALLLSPTKPSSQVTCPLIQRKFILYRKDKVPGTEV